MPVLSDDWYRAAAWLGSDQFDAALAYAPCGCDLERRAQRERNAVVRAERLREAAEARERWCCPYAGHEPRELPTEQREALGAIEYLTGWAGPPTCPRAALSQPGLLDALRLLPAIEHGTLPTLTHLPAVLHEAAYACAAGKGERLEYEDKVREQRRKAAGSG